MKRLALLLFLLAVCAGSELSALRDASHTASAQASKDLAGTYTIASSANPDGSGGYNGKVRIDKLGGSWSLTWMIPNSTEYRGVGIQLGDTLAVGWGMGEDYGVAAYRIGEGRLDGVWTTAGERGAIGSELLEGTSALNGTYRIVKGQSANGERRYSGTVSIVPRGAVYSVKWNLTRETFEGVGIRQGNILVVGWGQSGRAAGVVAYRIAERGLNGRWASPGDTRLGSENLVISTP